MRWAKRLIWLSPAVAAGVVWFLTARALESEYGIFPSMHPESWLLIPFLVILWYPLIRAWDDKRGKGDRDWTELTEPFRSRARSLFLRYTGWCWAWAGASAAALVLYHQEVLGFWPAMSVPAVLLVALFMAGRSMKLAMWKLWAEEERARSGGLLDRRGSESPAGDEPVPSADETLWEKIVMWASVAALIVAVVVGSTATRIFASSVLILLASLALTKRLRSG